MLFQRKQVLPLILILTLVLGAQATLIAASRVPTSEREITAAGKTLGVLDIHAWGIWLHIRSQ
jgi:hypothetical protein